jgi:hypothetical protein
VKDEKGYLVTYSHSILARWRNHFSQLFNVHVVSNGRQTEMHTAKALVPELSAFQVEMAVEKLKGHKSPGIDQIPADLIKAGGIKIHSEIHKLITSIWNKEELPEEYKILSNDLLSSLTPYAEEITWDHQCGFRRNRSNTDHTFCIRQIFEKKWEYNEAVHLLIIDFKKSYDSFRREFLYSIFIEFGSPMKLVRLIEMCLNETYSRVRVGKHLSDMFPIRNGLK